MSTTDALTALRHAAALAHGAPDVGLRIRTRTGESVAVHAGAQAPDLDPHEFRRAVLEAWRIEQEGGTLRLLDLMGGDDPAIDVRLPSCGEARAGGLYRLPVGGRWVWVFVLDLDVDVAFEVGAPIVAAFGSVRGLRSLGIRPDPCLGLGIVFAETEAPPGSADEARTIDLLESLLARWRVHQLLVDLGVEVADPA